MHPDPKYTEGKTDFLVDEVQYILDHYCYTFTIPRISWHADIATLERAMWFFGYKGYRYRDKDLQAGFVYFKNPEAKLRKALAQEASNFGLDTSTEIVKTEIDRELPAPTHIDLMVPSEDIPDMQYPQSVNEWASYIKEWGHRKGWDYPADKVPEKLMLTVGELAEAMEEYRRDRITTWYNDDGKPEGFGIELADTIIRILHLCDVYKIDMQACLEIKMAYNEKRPYRHGNLKA